MCKFKYEVDFIKSKLSDHFNLEKVEIEYAVYDTNVHHDSKWIES